MENLLIIFFVVLIIGITIQWTQREGKTKQLTRNKTQTTKRNSSQSLPTLNDLKREAEMAFPRLKVKERNGQIMVCEIDHRGELNELLFIKLDRNKPCKIEEKGRFIDSTFPYVPKSAELKRLFGSKLNKY